MFNPFLDIAISFKLMNFSHFLILKNIQLFNPFRRSPLSKCDANADASPKGTVKKESIPTGKVITNFAVIRFISYTHPN